MGWAALSYMKAQHTQYSSVLVGLLPTAVDTICLGVKCKLGNSTGWQDNEDYMRGSYSLTKSQWDLWAEDPDASPGGSFTHINANSVRLITLVGSPNSRAELRDSAHHRAPGETKTYPINGSFHISGVINTVASNNDTLHTFGLLRAHASGWLSWENALVFTTMTDTGPSANWQCVMNSKTLEEGGQRKVVDTGLSHTTARTLEIIWNAALRRVQFIVGGGVVHTETASEFLPRTENQGFLGISIRDPEADHAGDVAVPTGDNAILRCNHLMQQKVFIPGYWAATPQSYFNPW